MFAADPQTAIKKAPIQVNYDDEQLWREFSPSSVDLAFNVVMAATLIWIPLTASAIGRCAFVKYRVTDKRIVVKTDAPWKSASFKLCHAYQGFTEVLVCR